jgi:hypothetical protein
MTVEFEILEASCDCLELMAERVCKEFGGKRDGPIVTMRTRAPFSDGRSGILAIPVTPTALVFEREGGETYRMVPAYCQYCGVKRVKPVSVSVHVKQTKKGRKKPVIDVPADAPED